MYKITSDTAKNAREFFFYFGTAIIVLCPVRNLPHGLILLHARSH